MKIMFVAPRYHTNFVPIVDGLVSKGHEIVYCVRYEGITENHKNVKLYKIKPSFFSFLIEKILRKNNNKNLENKMLSLFIPNVVNIKKIIKNSIPDVLIIRDRNLFSLIAYYICKRNNVKHCILYNQSPLYIKDINVNNRTNIKDFLKKNLFPKKTITVVEYSDYPESNVEYRKSKDTYYLPFVPRNQNRELVKEYFKNNIVNILDIGKYRPYKNHKVLIKAAKLLLDKKYCDFHITIIGQVSNEEEKEIYIELNDLVKKHKLSEHITLLKEIKYIEIDKYFCENDIFVLPSKNEIAAISNVDAMSYGLATISTNKNGTASYIRNNIDGFIFESNSEIDLADKISRYLNNRNLIKEHGQNGKERAIDLYSFDKYYNKFMELLK